LIFDLMVVVLAQREESLVDVGITAFGYSIIHDATHPSLPLLPYVPGFAIELPISNSMNRERPKPLLWDPKLQDGALAL
jgi:hypothetical protein